MNTELVRIWGSTETIPEVETIGEQSAEKTTSYISLEFELWKNLFHAQTPSYQDFLQGEGNKLAEALVQNKSQVRFSLPNRITVPAPDTTIQGSHSVLVLPAMREQKVGGWVRNLARKKLIEILKQKLEELESHVDPSVAASAGLIRYALAINLAHHMLPNGNRVIYLTVPGDEIPTIPMINNDKNSLSVNVPSNGISETSSVFNVSDNVNFQETYTPDARRFFLPQWVSFDSLDRLLVNSFHEAERSLDSMKHYLRVLNLAISLAPYLIADPEYQEKRYGILGQLINQGRAMARYEIKEIIQIIQQRVKTNSLNRGITLNMTYFNDLSLELESRKFRVIPAGRILFHPAFVVLAARNERAKINQDLRLSYSTRKHFQEKLLDLERAFDTTKSQNEK